MWPAIRPDEQVEARSWVYASPAPLSVHNPGSWAAWCCCAAACGVKRTTSDLQFPESAGDLHAARSYSLISPPSQSTRKITYDRYFSDWISSTSELSAAAERLLALEIELARSFGVTWDEVGAVLGVSRQAAWDRFACHERWQKSRRISQLRTSRTAVLKKAAILREVRDQIDGSDMELLALKRWLLPLAAGLVCAFIDQSLLLISWIPFILGVASAALLRSWWAVLLTPIALSIGTLFGLAAAGSRLNDIADPGFIPSLTFFVLLALLQSAIGAAIGAPLGKQIERATVRPSSIRG